MSSKKASNNLECCPIKRQYSGLFSRAKARNQFYSLIWRRNKPVASDGNRSFLGRPARSLATICTELSRVSRIRIVRFTIVTASIIFEYHIRIKNVGAIRMSVVYIYIYIYIYISISI
jgi:hypothetical protein